MTQEENDYGLRKKYKEALEKAKEFYILCKKCGAKDTVDFLEDSFPELKESDNEKIRKTLIRFFKDNYPNETEMYDGTVTVGKALAWLEKQGEQKSSIVDFKAKDWYVSKVDGKIHNAKYMEKTSTNQASEKQSKPYGQREECLDCQFNYAGECKGSCTMKRNEQKSADKVEPKFHKGDWIISTLPGIKYPHLITDVRDGYYIFGEDNDHAHIASNDDVLKLWTIQDAKDGDVLAVDSKPFIYNGSKNEVTVGAYCGFNSEHKFSFAYNYVINQNITPATKEQRDLLFQKMKEAGYEWDDEKKELKKISQRMVSAEAKEALYDKPAWSEEDECYMAECINVIATKDGWSFEEKRKTKHWLKSLKQRIGWKPSDEQMKALHDLNLTGNISYAGQGQVLIELYNDLKKLTE